MTRPIALPAGGLTDGTVRVRRWRTSDLPALVAACQDPEIPRWTRVPSPYTEVEGRAFLALTDDWLRAGTDVACAVVDAASDVLLGATGVHRIGAAPVAEDESLVPNEVGYWLAKEARGRGVASRAVELLSAWALESFGIDELCLQVVDGNERSVAVARRSGYRYRDARVVVERGKPVTMLRFVRT